ncbi:ash family protein [uncultured Actinobacillus sp.]|uniref:ash family protein n=1 Tax=uncultured Actinobacillus sp. TaxID=417616 RepID=UPI0025E6AC7F|nr:ash family protein [uncultured Actinobacillus sp.]
MKKVITILQASKGYEEYSKEIHSEINQLEKISFHKIIKAFYPDDVVAKSATERGNSNNQSLANSSTPLIRAFFVRSIRTPKENTVPKNRERGFLSMVERIGQRLIVGCVPVIAVFHPDTFYRQAWKLAVVPEKLSLELLAMIYLFKAVSRRDLRNTSKPIHTFPCYTLRIKAESLEQAKSIVCPLFAVMGVVYA